MKNRRFATSIHILTVLAHHKDAYVNSETIAGSIKINPVLVRKEISNMKKAGLIESKEGLSGGSRLAKPAEDIRLSEVLLAIKADDEFLLGQEEIDPNPKCPIGAQINKILNMLFIDIDQLVCKHLKKKTLADFHAQFT